MTSLRMWSEPDEARMWLLCLPPGGGAAHPYRDWARHLPPALGVAALELPGHGSRAAEPAARDEAALVRVLAADAAPLLGRPVVLFGHSMGAILALDLAFRLRRESGWRPAALIAAASLPSPSAADTAADVPDELLQLQLRAWGGTAYELLGDPEYFAEIAPVLRADLALMAGRAGGAEAPLDCPLYVYLGADDAGVDVRTAGDLWARQTTAGQRVRIFPGGHFFTVQAADMVLAALVEDADAAVGGLLSGASKRAGA